MSILCLIPIFIIWSTPYSSCISGFLSPLIFDPLVSDLSVELPSSLATACLPAELPLPAITRLSKTKQSFFFKAAALSFHSSGASVANVWR